MRVVYPKNREVAIYYALTKPDPTSKLCSGVMVEIDDVHIFPELRDDACTSLAERKKKWPEKVRQILGQSQKAKCDAKRTDDKTKFVHEPERAIPAEITSRL